MKIAFISLGCDKNRVNTEQMMALCQAAGHEVTGEPDGADVAVVNTCGFIDSAKEEAIATILEVAPLKETGRLKKLLEAGCLSQRYQDEVLTELPEVDGILGTGSYTDIVSAAEAAMAGETPKLFGDIDRTVEDGARLVSTPSYTAFLKIAEGCNNRCAFCVIPSLRGRYRSRPMESLLAEAGQLAGAGVKELILVAQDITRYAPTCTAAMPCRTAAGAVQAGLPLDSAALFLPGRGHRRAHRGGGLGAQDREVSGYPAAALQRWHPEGHEPPGHQGADRSVAEQAPGADSRPGHPHLHHLRPARRERGGV